LSASWLPGLGYYHATNWTIWLVFTVMGCLCLSVISETVFCQLRRGTGAIAAGLSLPALLIAPWPYRAGILAFAIGCLASGGWPRHSSRWEWLQHRLCSTGTLSGVVLIVQALTINAYAVFTSRSHESPAPLPRVLAGVFSLLGVESAVDGQTVALYSTRQIHRLGATWELLFDPVTVCFIAAAMLVMWSCRSGGADEARDQRKFMRGICATLALVIVLWLPLRAGLMVDLFLHDVLRTPYEAELDAMRLFWSTWLHLLLLAGPIFICMALSPRPSRCRLYGEIRPSTQRATGKVRLDATLIAAALASLIVTIGLFWDPVGSRQPGRVVVEEHHHGLALSSAPIACSALTPCLSSRIGRHWSRIPSCNSLRAWILPPLARSPPAGPGDAPRFAASP
jgi:hypothetical protein